MSHPNILHVKEKGDVASCTEIPPKCSEFPPPADNLEDFFLDLALKGGIEFVPKEDGTYSWFTRITSTKLVTGQFQHGNSRTKTHSEW